MNNQKQIKNLESVAARQYAEFKKLSAEGKNTLAVIKFNQHLATIHAICSLEA